MASPASEISIRPMVSDDVGEAWGIVQRAFANHLGMNPENFWQERNSVVSRWHSYPSLSFVAVLDNRLVGCALAANWGSLGVLGPVASRPEIWNRGIAKGLVAAVLEQLDAAGTRQTVLVTFSDSPKHIALYQKFGFWPRYLTTIMTTTSPTVMVVPEAQRFSRISAPERVSALNACRSLTTVLSNGLDLTREIAAYSEAGYGDTVILMERSEAIGIGVCELGATSAAGAGVCLIRFGAVQSGPDAPRRFERLLAACGQLAADSGMSRLVTSVNAENVDVYRLLQARGFRPERNFVAMHRPNAPVYAPAGYIVADWR